MTILCLWLLERTNNMVTDNIKERLTSVLEKLNYNTNYNEIILSNRKDLCDYQYDGSFKQAK